MRNAAVGALIYEFLFDVYRLIEREEITAPPGAFSHDFISCWEWSTSILEKVGALVHAASPYPEASTEKLPRSSIRSPFYYPAMSLQQCRDTDFSAFETFDNYCYAMFTFSQFVHGPHVNAAHMSAQFLNAVAAEDDIFSVDCFDRVIFLEDRFREKVMSRWEEMEIRVFQRKPEA